MDSDSQSDSEQEQKEPKITKLEVDTNFYENISDYFLLLTDKKVKNRSDAMAMIKSCLRRNVQIDVFLQHSETLCTDLLSFIRKEKPLEYATGACQVLSLLQIALALESSVVYDVAYPTLFQHIKTSKSSPYVVECLRTACITLFVCEVPDEDVNDMIALLMELLSRPKCDNKVAATAIQMWMLLSSVRAKYQIITEAFPSFVSSVYNALTVQDVQLRITAAKCMAFLRELHLDSPSLGLIDVEVMNQRMDDVISEYNRYWKQSKDKELKVALREVSSSFKTNGHPELEMKYKLENGTVVTLNLNRWPYVIQYEVLRDILQDGFVHFLSRSDFLSQVFSTSISVQSLGSKEHKSAVAEVSRMKRSSIQHQRQKREAELQYYESSCLYDPYD